MDTRNFPLLTPEDLENGLIHGNLDKSALETLLNTNVHENENIDTLVNFFLQYIPGHRTMDEFIAKSKIERLHSMFERNPPSFIF